MSRSRFEAAQALACYPHPHDLSRPSLLVRAYGKLFGQVFQPQTPFARSLAFTREAWVDARGFPEQLGWVEDGVFGRAVAAKHACIATRDAEVQWHQRGSLSKTVRMYFNYGIGAAQSGDRGLIARDAMRVAAYLGSALVAARFGRRAVPLLLSGAACYYSLPIARVRHAHGGLRVAAMVPVVMAVKDGAKVAGAATGWRRKRYAWHSRTAI